MKRTGFRIPCIAFAASLAIAIVPSAVHAQSSAPPSNAPPHAQSSVGPSPAPSSSSTPAVDDEQETPRAALEHTPIEASSEPVASTPPSEADQPASASPPPEREEDVLEARTRSIRMRPARAVVSPLVGLLAGGLLATGTTFAALYSTCGPNAGLPTDGNPGPGCLGSLSAAGGIGGFFGATLGVTLTATLMHGRGSPTVALLGALSGSTLSAIVSASVIAAGGMQDDAFLGLQIGLALLPAIGAAVAYELSSSSWEHAHAPDAAIAPHARRPVLTPSLSVAQSGLARTIVPSLTLTTF